MGSLAAITLPPHPLTMVYLDLCQAKGQSDGWEAYSNLSAYRVLMGGGSPGSPPGFCVVVRELRQIWGGAGKGAQLFWAV